MDLSKILSRLSKKRPLFHSEADFQHALAWEIQSVYSQFNIRLEYPVQLDQRIYMDIWLRDGSNSPVGIELKYKTRQLTVDSASEAYELKSQSAQDLGRYDFFKDVSRIEKFSADAKGIGFAVFLTNDASYWKYSARKSTIDSAFRMHDGRAVEGKLAWQGGSEGTLRGREKPIKLNNRYWLHWQDYSILTGMKNNVFRYLLLSI